MASSGAFTGEARRTAGSPVRLLAVIALAFSALSIALAGAGPSPVANTSVPAAVALLPDAFYTLGMDDARAAQAAEPEELAHLGSQDRFEIARFHRLYQAARAKQEAERAAPPRNRR